MESIRIAVIGLGKMGLLHTGILSSMNNVELVALCEQKKLMIQLAKRVLDKKIKVVNTINALADFDLDAITSHPITFSF